MSEQIYGPSTNERREELRTLVHEVKRLAAARALSLPAAGITSAAAAIFGAALMGALVVLGTSGLGVVAVAISRQLLANKTERALALTKALRDEGALSDNEFAEYMLTLKNASEGSPVKA